MTWFEASPLSGTRSASRHLALVVALLFLQFVLRSVNITAQEVFVDEGYHLQRAAIVWSFQQNPGQFSEGKFLVYFWLGLFQGPRSTVLAASRLSMALFSLITGAGLYLVARMLYGHAAGSVALTLYVLLPLSLFFERMALADPFVSGWAVLAAWRSLVFARRPSYREGIVLGVMIALTTMAKLTMVLIPLLPVAAALIYFRWQRGALRPQIRCWLRRYLPSLIVAAFVVVALWLPVLVPAYLARDSGKPFALVNTTTVRTESTTGLAGAGRYLANVMPLVTDFVGSGLLVVAALGLFVGLLRWCRNGICLRHTLFLMALLLIATAAVIFLSGLPTARYFVPAAVPLCILVSGFAVYLWNVQPVRRLSRFVVVAAGLVWLATFALPADRAVIAAPLELPLSPPNHYEYQSGSITADEATIDLARFLNMATLPRLYANWQLCPLLYLYLDRPLHCFKQFATKPDMAAQLAAELEACDVALVNLGGNAPPVFFDEMGSAFQWQEITQYQHPRLSTPIRLFMVRRAGCK
jgi:4-amino-4-deoxy-L-arabinose transferase-like glycosyltransferase